MQFLIGYLFCALFGAQPFVDDLYTRAENEDQQEYGDVARRQQGLLKISWSAGGASGRGRLQAAEKGMIDAGEASIEDKQGYNNESVDKEFLFVQPFGDEQKGIEIIKGYQQDIVQNKEGREISFGKEREIPRSRVKYKRDHQKADPGCYMNDHLNDPFFQNRRSHYLQMEEKYVISPS